MYFTSETDSIGKTDHDDLGRSITTDTYATESYIRNVRRIFLSQPVLNAEKFKAEKRVCSEPDLHYKVNYDDLCGPWVFPKNPIYEKYDEQLIPKLCTWTLITQKDMEYMKQHQNDQTAVITLIGNKLPENIIFGGKNKNIFLILMWQVFRFTRDNYFNEKGVSTALGLFYVTHRFFLSHLQRTADETHSFFYKSLLLHAVMDPPKNDEVFTPVECKQLLDLFWTTYMQQLPLIRLVCLPNHRLIMKLKKPHFDADDELASNSPNVSKK